MQLVNCKDNDNDQHLHFSCHLDLNSRYDPYHSLLFEFNDDFIDTIKSCYRKIINKRLWQKVK